MNPSPFPYQGEGDKGVRVDNKLCQESATIMKSSG
jgi:hypothetical protein